MGAIWEWLEKKYSSQHEASHEARTVAYVIKCMTPAANAIDTTVYTNTSVKHRQNNFFKFYLLNKVVH